MNDRYFKYGDAVKISEKLHGKVIAYQNNGKDVVVLLPDGSGRTLSEEDLIMINLRA